MTQKDKNRLAPKNTAFSLNVLSAAHKARMTHGLRHKDYQLYRQYCSRRIRRLRKRFDLRQGDRRFKRKELNPDNAKEEKILELPLMQAERYWAYAMQLKEESIQDKRKKFAFRNKLRKAAAHSVAFEHFMEACGKCDARTQLEVQGYCAWLQGTVLFELADWTQQWDSPIIFFNKAIAIYSKLGDAVSEDEAGIIKLLLSEVEVQLRYCRHHLGDASATSSLLQMTGDTALGDKLGVLVSQAREKQAATLSEVTWKGRTLAVKHEKVRMFLLRESESGAGNEGGTVLKADDLDRLLMECKDAISIVRDDLNTDATFKPRQQANSGPVSSGHFLYSYLSFLRLRLSVQRNLVLLTNYKGYIDGSFTPPSGVKMPREQDLVRLCDLSIQNLSEMKHLAGLEEDLELQQQNDAQIGYFKAMRCFHIAECFAKQEKWTEALALYTRAGNRAEEAHNHPNLAKKDATTLKVLIGRLEGISCSTKAKALQVKASSSESSPVLSSKKPLCDRLDEYLEDPCLLNPSNPRVFPLPPALAPVPCKPLFFDLALNHIVFPDLEHKLPGASNRLQESKTEGDATQPGGLSGLVKGLWGWGSKH